METREIEQELLHNISEKLQSQITTVRVFAERFTRMLDDVQNWKTEAYEIKIMFDIMHGLVVEAEETSDILERLLFPNKQQTA